MPLFVAIDIFQIIGTARNVPDRVRRSPSGVMGGLFIRTHGLVLVLP